jgi:hypothetical protein
VRARVDAALLAGARQRLAGAPRERLGDWAHTEAPRLRARTAHRSGRRGLARRRAPHRGCRGVGDRRDPPRARRGAARVHRSGAA